ncbi:CBO0543 family protein, partial [Neobacillus niacini]|uniref:CBO0543 family protein n=1 Tax=Neobacillus niacini TaxID=86668 RepID=UPI002FFEFC81
EYPVQLLPDANKYNKTSFSYEFFLLPMIAIIFSLYFPKSNTIKVKILYYLLFAGLFTVIEVILQKTTNLVMYHQWKWYWTLFSLILALYINHQYYLWFKKQLTKVEKQ